MIYRIYFEETNPIKTATLLESSLAAFTVIRGVGYWDGQRELTTIIEHITDNPYGMELICSLAGWLKIANNQEAVLVVRITGDSVLI